MNRREAVKRLAGCAASLPVLIGVGGDVAQLDETGRPWRLHIDDPGAAALVQAVYLNGTAIECTEFDRREGWVRSFPGLVEKDGMLVVDSIPRDANDEILETVLYGEVRAKWNDGKLPEIA